MALAETGITVSMVKNALGVSSTDVGALCKSGNINCWSKKKPVILNNPAPNRNSEWWQGSTGNCGLTPYLITNYTKIPDAYKLNDNNMNGWIYNPPTGGSVAPYRLADFGGYDHNANPPLRNFTAPTRAALNGSGFYCSCMLQMQNETSLTFADFNSGLRDYYFGAYITNGSMAQIATSESTLANGASTVQFKMTGFSTGTWTAYPFLAQNQIVQNTGMSANIFYSVPCVSTTTINIISSLITITVTATANKSLRSISYKVVVNNLDSTSRQLTNNYVYLRFANKDFNDTMVMGEQRIKLDDVTVGTGSTTVAQGFFSNVDDDVMANPKVWASFQNATYKQSVIPMQSVTP